ncbi:hypothetical protein PBV87_00050 [Niameybacter massiliensis]|uniref:Uncharacterized protein n=1 Tax=Holtiella tumoricola TaxID=3018743 RepID=A0AA42IY86_9FIRM|nr:hypothetical protein [Holtiella tumoricola]MDA3729903.1 hypothetical protein [Holtiella tumoricola]
MEFQGNIVILGFNEWAIDESPQSRKEGVTIFYLTPTPTKEPGKQGYFPVKKSYDLSLSKDLRSQTFPLQCEATFKLTSNTKGNAVVDLVSFKPTKTLDIFKQ